MKQLDRGSPRSQFPNEVAAHPRLQPDLPPPYRVGPGVKRQYDLRGRILGVQDAAKLVGYGRTQMWRDARDGKVRCIVEGTALRPVYRFRLEDVLEWKERRETQMQLDRERAERRAKRRLNRKQQEQLRWLFSPGSGLRKWSRLCSLPVASQGDQQ